MKASLASNSTAKTKVQRTLKRKESSRLLKVRAGNSDNAKQWQVNNI